MITAAALLFFATAATDDTPSRMEVAQEAWGICILSQRDRLRVSDERPEDIAAAILSACRELEAIVRARLSDELAVMSDPTERRTLVDELMQETRAVFREALVGHVVEYRLSQ